MTTPHKRREELWLISEEMFEESPDGIIVIDEHCLMRHINPAFYRMFGYQGVESEIDNRPLDTVMASTQIDQYYDQKVVGIAVDARHRNGECMKCDVAMTPLRRSRPGQRRVYMRLIHKNAASA